MLCACSETLARLKPTLDYNKLPLFIFVNKGIEVGTHALTLDIIADTCGPEVAKISTFIVSGRALLILWYLIDHVNKRTSTRLSKETNRSS